MNKIIKIAYTCPKCGHKWNRNRRVYEGSLWNEDAQQERLCTACDKMRSASVHERTALILRTQARALYAKRAARRSMKEIDHS